jgi:hypothetical protein
MHIARFSCLLLALAGVLIFGAKGVFAQASPEAQQACTPDAMRLCADVIPDVAKVTACMMKKRSQLSEACRVAMGSGGHGHRHRYHHCRHC